MTKPEPQAKTPSLALLLKLDEGLVPGIGRRDLACRDRLLHLRHVAPVETGQVALLGHQGRNVGQLVVRECPDVVVALHQRSHGHGDRRAVVPGHLPGIGIVVEDRPGVFLQVTFIDHVGAVEQAGIAELRGHEVARAVDHRAVDVLDARCQGRPVRKPAGVDRLDQFGIDVAAHDVAAGLDEVGRESGADLLEGLIVRGNVAELRRLAVLGQIAAHQLGQVVACPGVPRDLPFGRGRTAGQRIGDDADADCCHRGGEFAPAHALECHGCLPVWTVATSVLERASGTSRRPALNPQNGSWVALGRSREDRLAQVRASL